MSDITNAAVGGGGRTEGRDKGRGCRSRDKIIKATLFHSSTSGASGGEKVIIIPAVSANDAEAATAGRRYAENDEARRKARDGQEGGRGGRKLNTMSIESAAGAAESKVKSGKAASIGQKRDARG